MPIRPRYWILLAVPACGFWRWRMNSPMLNSMVTQKERNRHIYLSLPFLVKPFAIPGFDLSEIFPTAIRPNNTYFCLYDMNQGLPYPDSFFDYIHMKDVFACFPATATKVGRNSGRGHGMLTKMSSPIVYHARDQAVFETRRLH